MLTWNKSELEKYRDKPLHFTKTIDVEEDLKERNSDIISVEPAKVDGYIFIDGKFIIAQYRVQVEMMHPSTRSLQPVKLPLDFNVSESYPLVDESELSDEEKDEQDVIIPLENDQVDLLTSVEDNILLNIPTQILTAEEAENGTMPSGNEWDVISEDDYNAGKEDEPVNPQMAKLKDYFKKSDNK